MHVLVTGGAGFIGSHLCRRLLAEGDQVTAVDNFDPFYPREMKRRAVKDLLAQGGFRLLEHDILQPERLSKALEGSGIDLFVHLAAKAGVRPSIEKPNDYLRVNIEGTSNMLDLASRLGVRAFIQGSSSSVYGDRTAVPFSESDPAGLPISPYAMSKRAAEMLAYTHHHLYGMAVHCLRFFTVYGPGQRPDLAIHKFARLMLDGNPIPLFGAGSTSRDYTYVEDIVDGIVRSANHALSHPPAYEIINLGHSSPVRLSDLVSMLGQALGIEPVIEFLPMQPGDVETTFANIEKAQGLLGYDPCISMEEGLRRFAVWFRQERARSTRSLLV